MYYRLPSRQTKQKKLRGHEYAYGSLFRPKPCQNGHFAGEASCGKKSAITRIGESSASQKFENILLPTVTKQTRTIKKINTPLL